MPTIAMSLASCAECEREFSYPTLDDSAYGDFILHREDGQDHRYLRAIGNKIWDYASARVPPRLLQEVIARLADRVDGKSFTMKLVCPFCKSHHFRDWGGKELSRTAITYASFEAFSSLDGDKKDDLLNSLVEQIDIATIKSCII